MDIVSGAAGAAWRHVAPGAHGHRGLRPGAALYALLITAALVRLVLAPLPGYFGDLQLYVNWGALFDRHMLDFYSAGAHVIPQPNYPPLTIYLYGLLTWIAGTWCHLTRAAGGSCTLNVGRAQSLNLFMKLPTLAAELALTGVIYAIARRHHSERAAVGFAAAYAFSPVVLLDGPLWGQIDALSTLGLVLALLAVARGRGLAAGVLFGLTVLVKPQPVVFAPLILVALWRIAGRRQALRGLAGIAGASIAVCLPYLLPPRFELLHFWQDTRQIVKALPNSTLSGFNLWWLVGAQQVRFSDPFVGPLSSTLVGWALFAAALAYALVRLWRDPTARQLWLGAGMVGVAFFVLTTLQHERYLYPAVALFLVAAIYQRRAWLLYALASCTAFANMVIILLNPVVSSSGLDVPSWRTHLAQRPEVAAGIAVLNLALLACAALSLSLPTTHPPGAVEAGMVSTSGALGADDTGTVASRPTSPSDAARGWDQLPEAGTEGDRAGIAATVARAPRTGMGEEMGEDMKGIADRFGCLRAWITTAEGRRFCSLLLLATLIRVIMLPYRGFFDDVQAFVTWGVFFVHQPLLFYSQGAHLSPVPDYPPLAMYLFGLLVAIDLGVHGLFGKSTPLQVNYSHTLPAIFKLPILLADLALIVVIYAVARRQLSPRAAAGAHRAPLLATAIYAFSPVVLFTGVLWGQIDPIFIVLVVLALLVAWKGQGVASGALFALAVLLKPQPVVLAPLLLVYLWRWHGRREALRAMAAMAVVAFVVCLPYLLPPHVDLLAFQGDLAAWERAVPFTSVSAFNLWWLLGAQRLPYTAPYLGPLSPNILGWGLFFAALAVALAGVWRLRSAGQLFFAAALIATAFFMLTPLQHERYLLPAVALMLLAAIYDRRYWLFYGLVTLAVTLNAVLVVIDPVFSDSKIPYNWGIGRHFLKTHPQVFVVLSALNVALLLAMLAWSLREQLAVGRAEAARAGTEAPGESSAGAASAGVPGWAAAEAGPRASTAASSALNGYHVGPAGGAEAETAITMQRVSIVLPAFNEEAVIAETVHACLRASERLCPNAEVIVVDDGSRDRTGAIADELAAGDARVVACHHPTNRGYGAALISGFAAARGDLIFFMDGDGQFDIEDLAALLRIERARPGTVVVGYRERRQDHLLRKVNAWGWKQAVRVVLGLRGIRDIDCAFKLFPAPLVRTCGVTSEGAMVNTELLVKLRRMGVAIEQVPVRHLPRTHGSATGANPRVIVKAFRELLTLRRRLHRWEPGPPAAIAPTQALDEPRTSVTPNPL